MLASYSDFGVGNAVLILDDEDQLRQFVRRALEQSGYEVHEAATGDVAVRIAESLPGLALVISDVVLPGMSAAAAWEAISVCCPEAKVLFTSGYTQADLVAQALLTPRTSLLQKPYKRAALLSAVRHALAPRDTAVLPLEIA